MQTVHIESGRESILVGPLGRLYELRWRLQIIRCVPLTRSSSRSKGTIGASRDAQLTPRFASIHQKKWRALNIKRMIRPMRIVPPVVK